MTRVVAAWALGRAGRANIAPLSAATGPFSRLNQGVRWGSNICQFALLGV